MQVLQNLIIKEERDETQWIGFAFNNIHSLRELPRSNKFYILEMLLDKVGDVQMFQLIHLLFGKEQNLRHELSYNMISSSTMTNLTKWKYLNNGIYQSYNFINPKLYFPYIISS